MIPVAGHGEHGHTIVRPDCSIKAVVWDCGGVIIRTEDDRGRREWERRLGLAHHELDRIRDGQ